MRGYLEAMRYWSSPWGPSRICSVSGTALRSVRTPFGKVPVCEDENHFHGYLIDPKSNQGFESEEEFKETLDKAKHMQSLSHRIVFTHGDLLSHNILVRVGHVSALLDWEASGWYPDYWEFTTGCRMQSPSSWWYKFVQDLSDEMYEVEYECDQALSRLTADSMVM